MNEIWKNIPGYENNYQINIFGKIKICRFLDRFLKPKKSKRGYYVVTLCSGGCPKTFYIHRLIAQAFIPNPENKPFINHKDGNKLNNSIENLEWCTPKENSQHAFKSGLAALGERHSQSKLKEKEVIEIYHSKERGVDLSKRFNISQTTIWEIRNNKYWTHLTVAKN